MADVLHRVTKELRRSVSEPDYPQSEWIWSPDLSAVAGRPSEEWVIEGDGDSAFVRAANDQEMAAIESSRLAAAKESRIREIDERAGVLLAAGVEYGQSMLSCSEKAQLNLLSFQILLASGRLTFPRPLSTIDGGEVVIVDAGELWTVSELVKNRVMSVLDRGRELRLAVKRASSRDELAAIVDDRV